MTKYLLALAVLGMGVGLSADCPQTKPLWTVVVENSPPFQKRVGECAYLGVWDGSGHYNCKCRERKPREATCYVMLSYPLKGYFNCLRANLYIPEELQ